MPRFTVVATDLFEDDLDAAVAYYLGSAGVSSARSLLDEYDAMCGLLAELPGYGANVYGTPYSWRPLERFVAVYEVDEDGCIVTLLRPFHMSSDWRGHLLGPQASIDDQ